MTDTEYQILDELYFVTPYDTLQKETGFSHEVLLENLRQLVSEGLVKIYTSMDEELLKTEVDLAANFRDYFYLASKKGLFKHNSR